MHYTHLAKLKGNVQSSIKFNVAPPKKETREYEVKLLVRNIVKEPQGCWQHIES